LLLIAAAVPVGCSGGGAPVAPIPTPSPSPTIAPGIYFVAKDGSLTDVSHYTVASPFPVSLSAYPTVTLEITNLGDLETDGLIDYVPAGNECYEKPVAATTNTITLGPNMSFQCGVGVEASDIFEAVSGPPGTAGIKDDFIYKVTK
jgi:hypothetical protein